MRGKKGAQARLRPTAGTSRPLIADLPSNPSGRSRVGRDSSGMVVSLDLDQDVGLSLAVPP